MGIDIVSILKIAKMGHPVLRTEGEELSKREILLPQTQHLIDDMIATMKDYNGIGLAAPQVHVSKTLCIIEVLHDHTGFSQDFPLTVLCNPKLDFPNTQKINVWEGCLSIPGIRGLVPRYQTVTASYLDHKGKEQKLEATGFFAAVIQHEVDHLQGCLFLDRMEKKEALAFTDEWARYWSEHQDTEEGSVRFL